MALVNEVVLRTSPHARISSDTTTVRLSATRSTARACRIQVNEDLADSLSAVLIRHGWTRRGGDPFAEEGSHSGAIPLRRGGWLCVVSSEVDSSGRRSTTLTIAMDRPDDRAR
jgi:hypothetical protein